MRLASRLVIFVGIIAALASEASAQNPGKLFGDILGGVINEAQRAEQQKQYQRYLNSLEPFLQACAKGNIGQCDAVLNSNPPDDIRNYVSQMRDQATASQEQARRQKDDARRQADRQLASQRELAMERAKQLFADCQRTDARFCDEGAALADIPDNVRDQFRQLKVNVEKSQIEKRERERQTELARVERERQEQATRQENERRDAAAREARVRTFESNRLSCKQRSEGACLSALSLAATDGDRQELREMLMIARAPLGLPILAELANIPTSTLVLGGTTAMLALALALLGLAVRRRPRTPLAVDTLMSMKTELSSDTGSQIRSIQAQPSAPSAYAAATDNITEFTQQPDPPMAKVAPQSVGDIRSMTPPQPPPPSPPPSPTTPRSEIASAITNNPASEAPPLVKAAAIVGLILALVGYIIPFVGVLFITPLSILSTGVALHGRDFKSLGLIATICNIVNLIISPTFWLNVATGSHFGGLNPNFLMSWFDIIGSIVLIGLIARKVAK